MLGAECTGMMVQVKVIPRAKKNAVEKADDGLRVRVTAPAVDNKANEAVIQLLADYFNTKRRQVILRSGEKSRVKTFEIIGL